MNPAPVIIQKHDPERRRQPVTTLHCGCTTCCCCCCLHTLGSLVGSAVAPAIGRGAALSSLTAMAYYEDAETGEQFSLVKKPGFSAVTIFWWILCLLTLLGFLIGIFVEGNRTDNIVITGIVILIFFPALQLASAFITIIVFAIWPRYDKRYQFMQLGKITAGIFVGTILGTLAMVAVAAAFGVLK